MKDKNYLSLAKEGVIVQSVMLVLALIASSLGTDKCGSASVVFLAGSLAPWCGVWWRLKKENSGEKVNLVEWNMATAGTVSAIFGFFSLSCIFGYYGGLPNPKISKFLIYLMIGAIPLVGGLAVKYFTALNSSKSDMIRTSIAYTKGSCFVGVVWLMGALFDLSGKTEISKYFGYAIFVLCFAVAIELILSIILEWYRPDDDDRRRLFFDSRLLSLFDRDQSLGKVVREGLEYQFGFDVSSVWFLRKLGTIFPILSFLVFIMIVALSGVFLVNPGEKAVVMRWGDPVALVSEGLHFKIPWPVDSIVKYDVNLVRRIHVGSHVPQSDDGAIYKEGTPILWTNEHGLRSEHFIPVAPPEDMSSVILKDKSPSVSLIGADVFVEFRVNDPMKFMRASDNTVDLFKKMAEAETSREFSLYDVDHIIGGGRVDAASRILEKLRKLSVSKDLGISVDYVGIVGVHPPQIVASFFEEIVSAKQEKETVIQWARQASVLRMTETVGNQKKALQLIDLIEKIDDNNSSLSQEKLAEVKMDIESILLDCGGSVASVLGSSIGYRAMREAQEGVRADQFKGRLGLLSAAPMYYERGLYLDVLDETLPSRRKYILPVETDDFIFRLNGLAPAVSLPVEMAE